MSRDQFLRLRIGARCFTHVGTSYRQVTVVELDVNAGIIGVECQAQGHGRRVITARRPFGLVDLRAYKPYPGLRWRDGRAFTQRVKG